MIKVRVSNSDILKAEKSSYYPFEIAIARVLNVDVHQIDLSLQYFTDTIAIFDDYDNIIARYKMDQEDVNIIHSHIESWDSGYEDNNFISFKMKKV